MFSVLSVFTAILNRSQWNKLRLMFYIQKLRHQKKKKKQLITILNSAEPFGNSLPSLKKLNLQSSNVKKKKVTFLLINSRVAIVFHFDLLLHN